MWSPASLEVMRLAVRKENGTMMRERMTRNPCGKVEPMFISMLPALVGQLICKGSWLLSTTGPGLREAVVLVQPQAIDMHK